MMYMIGYRKMHCSACGKKFVFRTIQRRDIVFCDLFDEDYEEPIICEKCAKKEEYAILSNTRVRLIENYRNRVRRFYQLINSLTKAAISKFSDELTVKFLEKVNPDAYKKYKMDKECYSERNIEKAREYAYEIRKDLLCYIVPYVDNYIKNNKKYISAKKILCRSEGRIKKIIAETDEGTLYYCYYKFSISPCFLNIFLTRMIARLATFLKISKTIIKVYEGAGSREDLWKKVYNTEKYEKHTDEKYIMRKKEFKKMLGRIAMLVEEDVD